ncbi:MAG: hypothetical protein RKR03_07015 [Candidatus Competibacter sp.]|nr:hypothetical protein [Candidatus Competibacter sp.]
MDNTILGRPYPRLGRIRAAHLWGLIWGGMGLVLALVVYAPTEWPATAGVLMMTQAFAVAVMWPRLRASQQAVLPDFLTIFLLFQTINKSLTLLNLLVRAAGVEDVRTIAIGFDFLTDLPNFYRWQAEWVFLAGTVFFTLGWLLIERRRPLFVWIEPSPRFLWHGFFASIGLYILLNKLGLAPAVGMLSGLLKLFAIGALAVLLGGKSHYGLGRKKSWLPILALLPLYYLSLQSGVKGEFALISMPILLPIFRRLTPPRLLGLSGFLAVVVLVVFPISQEARKANWESYRGSENLDTIELLARVENRWAFDGVFTTAVDSSTKWLARGASADIGGLVMQIADQDGHIGAFLIKDLLYIFIPRFLWPGKPRFMPGAWFTWYLGGASSPEAASSATAMMLPTEMYWMYGWVGVVVGMILLGLLYAWCWKMLIKLSTSSLIGLLALFAYVIRAGNLESTHSLYAIAEPITFLVYIFGLNWMVQFVSPRWIRLTVRRP